MATDVVLSEDPEEQLKDLVAGYRGLGKGVKK